MQNKIAFKTALILSPSKREFGVGTLTPLASKIMVATAKRKPIPPVIIPAIAKPSGLIFILVIAKATASSPIISENAVTQQQRSEIIPSTIDAIPKPKKRLSLFCASSCSLKSAFKFTLPLKSLSYRNFSSEFPLSKGRFCRGEKYPFGLGS